MVPTITAYFAIVNNSGILMNEMTEPSLRQETLVGESGA